MSSILGRNANKHRQNSGLKSELKILICYQQHICNISFQPQLVVVQYSSYIEYPALASDSVSLKTCFPEKKNDLTLQNKN